MLNFGLQYIHVYFAQPKGLIMLPLEDALAQMLNQLPFPTKTETLALTEAADRVCAEDVISPKCIFTVDKRPDDFLMRVYPYIDKNIDRKSVV